MTPETPTLDSQGPICPNCRAELRDHLRHERLIARDPADSGPLRSALVTFCGSCGWTLAVTAARQPFQDARGPGGDEVVDPSDPASIGGQFQLRCRALVSEIEALGFTPGGWIGLINRLGAAKAATSLLSSNRTLPVTHWLVDQGHPELTMEHEVGDPKWRELFSDELRAQAERLLSKAGGGPRPQ